MVLEKSSFLSERAKDVDVANGVPAPGGIPTSSLCRYATSHGNAVWGLHTRDSWRVDMNEQIDIVTESSDGSLVFVVTVGGAASLLRGSDGRALYTKTLEPSASPIMTSWIRQSEEALTSQPSNNAHALLLVTTPEAGIERQAVVTRLTLVRNLSGSSDEQEGGRGRPKVYTTTVEGYCFGAVTGKFVDNQETRLRIVGCSKLMDEALVMLEWDCADNRVSVIASSSSDAFDCRSGLLPLRIQCGHSVILCSTYLENSRRTVDWLCESSLELLCRYDLPGEDRVTAMEALGSYAPSESLAFAVTVSAAHSSASPPRRLIIHVLQLLMEESMGLAVLSSPHVLYTVPLDPGCIKVDLASSLSLPYSFHIKTWACDDGREFAYWSFSPPEKSSLLLAKIRRSLELGNVDEASDLLCEDENLGNESLFDDAYANFAPTEVPFRRLQAALLPDTTGRRGPNMSAIQRCMRNLVQSVSRKSRQPKLVLSHLYQTVDFLTSLKCAQTPAEAESLLLEATSMIATLTSGDELGHLGGEDDCSEVLARRQNTIQGQLDVVRFLLSLEAEGGNGGGVSPAVDFDDRIRDVKSLPHLFETLVSAGNFAAARLMWHQSKGSQIELSSEALVSAVLQIPPAFPPHEYAALLEDIILLRLSCNHEYLYCIRSWACRMADSLDDSTFGRRGLDSAIHLLEIVERGTETLRLRASLFASECPLNESNESAWRVDRTLLAAPHLAFGVPRSTFARRLDPVNYHPPREDRYDDNDDSVGEKLLEARCLRDARTLGLRQDLLSLRKLSAVKRARSQYIAEKLIELAMDAASSETLLQESIEPFCKKYLVHYDTAIYRYVEARSKDKPDELLSLCARAAQCCASDAMKGKSALCVLRAVQQRGISPDWLQQLSARAVLWTSGDSGTQSEIKELSRLLRIEGIIIKYCGAEARRFFSVDNPRHSLRLLKFVTMCFNKNSVLVDALALCDTFSHLSRRDAVGRIIQHAMSKQDSIHCASIITSLYCRDRTLAEQTLVSALAYAEEVLRERPLRSDATWTGYLAKGHSAVCCMLAIISALLKQTGTFTLSTFSELRWILRANSLTSLKQIYDQVKRLQVDFDVYASLHELSCPNFVITEASSLLQPVIDAHLSGESMFVAARNLARAKEACSLLIIDETRSVLNEVWSTVCGQAVVSLIQCRRDAGLLDLLQLIGLFDKPASFELLPIANALCLAAYHGDHAHSDGAYSCDGMTRVVNAAHFLQDRFLLETRGKYLLSAVWFGSLVDTICEILCRCDDGIGELLGEERLKRRNALRGSAPRATNSNASDLYEEVYSSIRPSKVHATWHAGDGLLLAPRQSLSHGVDIFLSAVGSSERLIPALDFLRHSGAHFLTLRVLSGVGATCCSRLSILRNHSLHCQISSAIEDSVASLARRCLGGQSHVGLTSGTIDPQLAAGCLLSLPREQAFIIYGRSIPSSLRSRSFPRLHLLAVVGVFASMEPSREVTEGFRTIGWKKQKRLNEQCQRMAIRSLWCDRLQRQPSAIPFDTWQLLTNGQDSSSNDQEGGAPYATSLLPDAVRKLSTSIPPPAVVAWYTKFSNTFGVSREVGIKAHIECCLAPLDSIESPSNMRSVLSDCETFVRNLLSLLEPQERLDVLRRCVTALESSSIFGTSYERFELGLALYHNEIISFRSQEKPDCNTCAPVPDSQIELIDRRREALKILLSCFHIDIAETRPRFPDFFSPLPIRGDSEVTRDTRICGVLGKANRDDERFDPIKPLEVLFAQAVDNSILTALAPLSSPLRLPEGYIDVRFLQTRFHLSGELPSFEHNVKPVLEKLSSEHDRTVVSEWCAERYTRSDEDEDRLKCLEFAFQSAYRMSAELELLTDCDTEEQAEARERVKRLLASKSALSDILGIKKSLHSASRDDGRIVLVIDGLISELDAFVAINGTPGPEALVGFLLSRGSLLAADAFNDTSRPLPASQLRKFCSIIHEACRPLAERCSSEPLQQRCTKLASQWLFHGDHDFGEAMNHMPSELGPAQPGTTELFEGVESAVRTFNRWKACGPDNEPSQKTMEGERSALRPLSRRELSMSSTRCVAIRIAIVLALSKQDERDLELGDGRNSEMMANSNQPSASLRPRRIRTSPDLLQSRGRESQILVQCRELLDVAFATKLKAATLHSGSSLYQLDETFNNSASSPIALTFAMRHRALLAATILCPEALDLVVKEEKRVCNLKACTFASFVAKEIEELGLSLPHSDLDRLGSMNYPSFARTLRKDHHDMMGRMGRGSTGRLLLLMVEMSLRSATSVHAAFVESLLQEMVRLHLPRTLLMSAELLCAYAADLGGMRLLLGGRAFQNALSTLSNSIVLELRQALEQTDEFLVKAASATISRLGCVLKSFESAEPDWILEIKRDLASLLPSIKDIELTRSSVKDADLIRSLYSVIAHFTEHPAAPVSRCTQADCEPRGLLSYEE